MNDDQVGRELHRRADSVSLDPDWITRELLPAVSAGISSGGTSPRASRLPALAGLAAALAVLGVLVVARPELLPIGATPTPDSLPTTLVAETAQPAPSAPRPAPSPSESSGTARTIDCVGSGRRVSVIDSTGLVTACRNVPSVDYHLNPEDLVTNPDGDPSALRLLWHTSSCASSATAEFTISNSWSRPDRTDALEAYELAVEEDTDPDCPMPHMSARGIELDLISNVRAALVSVALGLPIPVARTLECAGSPSGEVNGAVWLEDHAGLVESCSVAATDPPDGPLLSSLEDPSELTLNWTTPCVMGRYLTRLELWSRAARLPVESWSPFKSPYVFVVNQLPPISPTPCLPVITGRQVTLQLAEPIPTADVDLVYTSDAQGSSTAVGGPNTFELSLTSDKLEYATNEPIELEIGLRYEGTRETLEYDDHRGPRLQIEQLDGRLEMATTHVNLVCGVDGPMTLRNGERFDLPYYKQVTYSEVDPDAEFYEWYFSDPQLRLPRGRYHLMVDLSFMGDGVCGKSTDRSFYLEASIVIEVR